jgi:hypothetical protein
MEQELLAAPMSRIEMGYRYTFLMNTTPVDAKQVNTLFLGVTRNFLFS